MSAEEKRFENDKAKPVIFDFTQCKASFLPLYFKLEAAKTRFVVNYGGKGSGKSYSQHQLELINLLDADYDILITRKIGADIKETCYKLLQKHAADWGITDQFDWHFSSQNREIRNKHTGHRIIFKGVDDPERLKSLVGIRRIVMEEASEYSFEDFLELNSRVRDSDDCQIVMLLNPISENHWINTNLVMASGAYHPYTTVLHTTYLDNHHLPPGYIQQLLLLEQINQNKYNIDVLGLWGVENKDKKFAWAFDRSKHVKPTQHQVGPCTFASFDFNVNPLACSVFQVFPQIQTVRFLECIRLENSDIWKMCERLKAAYPCVNWKITGDATGHNRQAISPDNRTYYDVIWTELNLSEMQFDKSKSNPRIEENQLMVNRIFKQWNVEIDPDKCKDLIYDLMYVEMDERNQIVKDRSSAKRCADFLDTLRYAFNTVIGPYLGRF